MRERWIVEHVRALELGGADDLQNMRPAHETYGREKARGDHARAAEAKRQKLRHLGAAVIARPLLGSRGGALKRKVNGTVVPHEGRLRSHRAAGCEVEEDNEAAAPASDPMLAGERAGPIERLCPQPRPTSEEVGSGVSDHMADRAITQAATVDCASVGDVASDDISPTIPRHLEFLFRDRLLLPGEDTEHYEALQRSIAQQVKPSDVTEAIWAKDVADLIWEAKRLRRWRQQILVQAQLKYAEELVRSPLANAGPSGFTRLAESTVDALAAGWVTGSKSEIAKVDAVLRERGFTAENGTVHGFVLNLSSIERIDQVASLADQRRDALLREIERKHANSTQLVPTDAADVLDVEHRNTPWVAIPTIEAAMKYHAETRCSPI